MSTINPSQPTFNPWIPSSTTGQNPSQTGEGPSATGGSALPVSSAGTSQNNANLQELLRQLADTLATLTSDQANARTQQPLSASPAFQNSSLIALLITLFGMLMQLPQSLGGAAQRVAQNAAQRAAEGATTIINIFMGGNPTNPGSPVQSMLQKGKIDPTLLDTNGDGQTPMTSTEDGVQFDMNGDGQKEQVAWTQANGENTDGWLAMDRNGNGQIDNGKELFGEQNGAANGFDELAKLDGNQDGILNNQDSAYHQLRIWKDKNHDGISQQNELSGLEEAGIASINTTYQNSNQQDAFGNAFRQIGSFQRTDAGASQIAQTQGISFNQARQGRAVDVWV
jgi:hypothetical protein